MTTPSSRPGLDELARGEIDATDLDTLRHLADFYESADPVPDGLVDRIQFGITLDALHAEIAELQRSGGVVGVRSEASTEAQTVTFTSSTMSTMVTITATSADRVRIDGWVAPGGGVTVELRIVSETRSTIADPDGRFVFDDVPRGLAQFTLRQPSGAQPPVVTPSIEL
jgi:hypothetical protein